jgi:cobalt-precorrin 5A hydrolase
VIAREQIAQRAWVGKPSAWVRQNIGVDGVCEPAALIASPRGRLLLGKTALDGVTVAIVDDADAWRILKIRKSWQECRWKPSRKKAY